MDLTVSLMLCNHSHRLKRKSQKVFIEERNQILVHFPVRKKSVMPADIGKKHLK